MPKIIVQKDTEILRVFNLPEKTEITIGCSNRCDVAIEDPSIAPEQAKISLKEDGFHLQLISHIPPVFVTEMRVEGDLRLEDGDTIRIEGYNLILNALPGEVIAKAEPVKPVSPIAPVEAPRPAVIEPIAEKTPEPAKSASLSPPPKKDLVQDVIESVLEKKEKLQQQTKPPEKPAPRISALEIPEARPIQAAPPPPAEKMNVISTEALEPSLPRQSREPAPPAGQKPEAPAKIEPAPKASEPPADSVRKTKVIAQPDLAAKVEPRPKATTPIESVMQLMAVAGPLKGESFKLRQGLNRIGRDRNQNEIAIRAEIQGELDKSISRQHALIEYSKGIYYLSDRTSQMRTKLNGKTISKEDVIPLKRGDLIEICSTKENIVFRFAAEGESDFSFSMPAKSGEVESKKSLLIYALAIIAAIIIIIVLILIFK